MKTTRLIMIFTLCFFITGCSDSKTSNNYDELEEINIDITDNKNISKPLDSEALDFGKDIIILKNALKDDSLVVVGEDEEGYGKLGVNIKEEHNQVLLCRDPV
ncbi:MAG: hypothetical protein GX321_06395 [Clostridiales bacterium]|nr:hypothetical protein [Clostridiales bacterium]